MIATRPGRTYLQYVGFDQSGSIRSFRFHRVSRGEPTTEFVVDADLGLFRKHGVGIQNGPALSLLRLAPDSDGTLAGTCPRSQSLTEADLAAHIARIREKAPKSKTPGARHAAGDGVRSESSGQLE